MDLNGGKKEVQLFFLLEKSNINILGLLKVLRYYRNHICRNRDY